MFKMCLSELMELTERSKKKNTSVSHSSVQVLVETLIKVMINHKNKNYILYRYLKILYHVFKNIKLLPM